MLIIRYPRVITAVLLYILLLLCSCQSQLNMTGAGSSIPCETNTQQEGASGASTTPASLTSTSIAQSHSQGTASTAPKRPSSAISSPSSAIKVTSRQDALLLLGLSEQQEQEGEQRPTKRQNITENLPTSSTTLVAPVSLDAVPLYDVFISYAGEDKATVAAPLYGALEECGIQTFFDRKELKVDIKDSEVITHAMKTARCGVFILSPEFTAEEWSMQELRCFLDRYEEAINEGTTPPLLFPVFYRLPWDDCKLDSKTFFVKHADYFTPAKSDFLQREATREASREQVMKTLQGLQCLHKLQCFTEIAREEDKYNYPSIYQLVAKITKKVHEEVRNTWPASMKSPRIDVGCKLRSYYLREDFALIESIFPGEESPKHVKDLPCTLQLILQDRDVEAKSQPFKEHLRVEALFADRSLQPGGPLHTIQKVLITGNTGVGRTTFGKHLAYRWAVGSWGQEFEAVYVLPASNLHQSEYDVSSYYKESTLATAIVNNCFTNVGDEESYQNLCQQVCKTLSSPSTLVVIDGSDGQVGVCKPLIEQAEAQSNHKLLMLLGSYGIEEERKMADIEVEHTGLNNSQLRSYVQTYLPSDQSASLLSLLSKYRSISEIAHVPVNLHILCLLWKEEVSRKRVSKAIGNGSLPGLYRIVTRKIWEHYIKQLEESVLREKMVKRADLSIEDREPLFDMLGKIALEGLKRGEKGLVSSAWVEDLVLDSEKNNLQILQNTDFLLFRWLPVSGQYQFPHITFQEYCAGRWLAKQLFLSDDVKALKEARSFFQQYKYASCYGTMFTFLAGEVSNHASKKQRCEDIGTLLTLANEGVAETYKSEIPHLCLQMRLVNEWLCVCDNEEIQKSFPKLEQSFGICGLLKEEWKEDICSMREEDSTNGYILHLTRLLTDFRSVAKQVVPRCLTMLLDGCYSEDDAYARHTCLSTIIRVGQLDRAECLVQLQAATTHTNTSVQKAAKYALSQLTNTLAPLVAFGPAEWAKYFGVEVGEAPSLPEDLGAILDSPCSFWVDKTVRETHLLFLLPATVNGVSFTLTKLGELIKTRFPDNEVGYSVYWDKVREKYGNKVHSESSYWVLMTRDILPGSGGMPTELFCQSEVANYSNEGYNLLYALEAATGILTHYVRTGERLFSDDPEAYTCCRELVDHDRGNSWPVVVGGFGLSGLDVSFNFSYYGYLQDGAACSRKL